MVDNVVLTPHIGGATYDVEVNHTTTVVDDLVRLTRGQKPTHARTVTPELTQLLETGCRR